MEYLLRHFTDLHVGLHIIRPVIVGPRGVGVYWHANGKCNHSLLQ